MMYNIGHNWNCGSQRGYMYTHVCVHMTHYIDVYTIAGIEPDYCVMSHCTYMYYLLVSRHIYGDTYPVHSYIVWIGESTLDVQM